MRIELPNRTVQSDKRLQNSTNNLINRHEHKRDSMLAWHTTGANGMRSNEVRTLVLRRVRTARPPLPQNSTRGLTPGLINPRLGNVPGNSIPQPDLRVGEGRLRVGRQALANAAQGNPAQANPAQTSQIQSTQMQNIQGQNNSGHDGAKKRNRRTSQETRDRPSKRQDTRPNYDSDRDTMDTRSDSSKSAGVWIDIESFCIHC